MFSVTSFNDIELTTNKNIIITTFCEIIYNVNYAYSDHSVHIIWKSMRMYYGRIASSNKYVHSHVSIKQNLVEFSKKI